LYRQLPEEVVLVGREETEEESLNRKKKWNTNEEEERYTPPSSLDEDFHHFLSPIWRWPTDGRNMLKTFWMRKSRIQTINNNGIHMTSNDFIQLMILNDYNYIQLHKL
jgi:hypothetical protein